MIQAGDLVVLGGLGVGAIEGLGRHRIQGIVDQGGLARAGDAGNAGEQTHRQVQVGVLEVVTPSALDLQLPLRVGSTALRRHGDALGAREVGAGE
ncbi:hypothetical protein SDC9_193121 [bioreactor metagenome]|uniref:Uncharacterized protein n=1 Tax=bioreactor metagenome TaxID=1076179 RepID=A0A645IB58_9ZZZZ